MYGNVCGLFTEERNTSLGLQGIVFPTVKLVNIRVGFAHFEWQN